jgi:tRNA(Leu) C34 or U34 (ribose-2'-O)-methylase TrmL
LAISLKKVILGITQTQYYVTVTGNNHEYWYADKENKGCEKEICKRLSGLLLIIPVASRQSLQVSKFAGTVSNNIQKQD